MTGALGNPFENPCSHIVRTNQLLGTIEKHALENIELELADKAAVNNGLNKLINETKREIFDVCVDQCANLGRCILDSFGYDDPLLFKPALTPDEEKELNAKTQLDMLSLLAERAMGIALR
jgi:hypothetical protein